MFILSFVMLSCSDLKKGRQLEHVIELSNSLDSVNLEWNKSDTILINDLFFDCSKTIDTIEFLYNNQKISLELAKKIDLYKHAKSDAQELKTIQNFYPTILKEKKQSLSLLKKDINKGSGRREKYDEYISFEQKELTTIKQQLEDYKSTQERCIKNYQSSQKDVHAFLTILKTEK